MSSLYCTATNCTNVISAIVAANHDSPVMTATIEARTSSLTLGDSVTIDLGYTSAHQVVFTGYVKQITRKIPDNTYIITAYDTLVRAQDFFIASSNPNEPFKRKNIKAEDLVADLLALAGLTDYDYTPTFFTFGVSNEFEVNLVMVYDYIRTICDTLTWSLWADSSGTVNFKNRKPYVMMGDTGQPGDVADVPTGFELTTPLTIDATYTKSEKSLRNRVVVYGAENVYAEAHASSSSLPAGFYKSAVLALTQLIDTNSLATDIANYNLNLLNRITEVISATIVGNASLSPRTVIEVTLPSLSITGNWYVYGCDHSWGRSGYTCSIDLRRMLPDTP